MPGEKNPILSLIIPVYNVEKYLRRCIDSVLTQRYRNIELILVDDGSTDSSGEICDEYRKYDDRVKVIHKVNGGPISARDAGVGITKGDYISFLDSDDWVEENNYLELVNGMALDTDIVVGSYVAENNNGELISCFSKGKKEIYDSYNALLMMFNSQLFNWSGCNKLYRRELFDGFVWWNNENSYGEDTEFNWFMFLKARRICYIPTQGYHYCMNEKSMMQRTFCVEMMAYMDRLNNILHEIEMDKAFLRHSVANLLVSFGLDKFPLLMNIVDKEDIFNRYYFQINEFIPYITFMLNKRQKNIFDTLKGGYLHSKEVFCGMEKKIVSKVMKMIDDGKSIYIYGAGVIGEEVYNILKKHGINVEAIVVTQKSRSKMFKNYKVYEFKDLAGIKVEKTGMVLAMNKKNTAEVISSLEHANFTFVDCGKHSLNY